MYQKLEALCAKKGVSVYEACKGSGVNQNAVSNVKNNPDRKFSFDTVEKFCVYFGVSMDYFRSN